jgi:hypothetical protein
MKLIVRLVAAARELFDRGSWAVEEAADAANEKVETEAEKAERKWKGRTSREADRGKIEKHCQQSILAILSQMPNEFRSTPMNRWDKFMLLKAAPWFANLNGLVLDLQGALEKVDVSDFVPPEHYLIYLHYSVVGTQVSFCGVHISVNVGKSLGSSETHRNYVEARTVNEALARKLETFAGTPCVLRGAITSSRLEYLIGEECHIRIVMNAMGGDGYRMAGIPDIQVMSANEIPDVPEEAPVS